MIWIPSMCRSNRTFSGPAAARTKKTEMRSVYMYHSNVEAPHLCAEVQRNLSANQVRGIAPRYDFPILCMWKMNDNQKKHIHVQMERLRRKFVYLSNHL